MVTGQLSKNVSNFSAFQECQIVQLCICKYNSLIVQIRNCAIVCVRPAARCGCSCDDHYLSPFIRRRHGLTRPGNFPAIIPDCAGLCNSRRLCCQHNVLLCGILAGFAKSVQIVWVYAKLADCAVLGNSLKMCFVQYIYVLIIICPPELSIFVFGEWKRLNFPC